MGRCNASPKQGGVKTVPFPGKEFTEKVFLLQRFVAVAHELPGEGGGVTEVTHN
jgi:hypothetical protein